MKKTNSKNPKAIIKKYIAPTIKVIYIQMEQSVATGSASNDPNTLNVQHEWEIGNDSEQEIYW